MSTESDGTSARQAQPGGLPPVADGVPGWVVSESPEGGGRGRRGVVGPVVGSEDTGVGGHSPAAAAVRGAMAGLVGLLAITVGWWALALWPVEGVPPAWLERARAVCFNAGPSGLPEASGWLLLVGQPIGMLAVLMVIAGDAVREGLRRAFASPAGLLGIAAGGGLLLAGLVLAAVRVAGAPGDAEWLENARAAVPSTYPRLDRPLPEVAGLVDQRGDGFSWERVAGRPALLTFGFGHCATVCPMTVMNARRVLDRFRAEGREMDLVVITLDPWRDTPGRLPSLAGQFHLDGDGAGGDGERVKAVPGETEHGGDGGVRDEGGSRAFLLSGTVEAVNAALDALQVARERVPDTGDIVHPALVYLLDGEGTIVYAASGHAELIEELARRM